MKSNLPKVILTLFIFFLFPLISFAFLSFPNQIDTKQERMNVQTVLNNVMTSSPNLVVDGVLGRKSIQAVQAFQEVNGLTADGKIGPITRAQLEKAQTNTLIQLNTNTYTLTECAPGILFSIITGRPCSTTISTLSLGCTSTTVFSPVTGVSCNKISTTPIPNIPITTAPVIPPPVVSRGGGGSSPAPTPTPTPTSTGNTYYISQSTGNDSNNGTSSSTPWKTIAKVNAQTFLPGDFILFKRGDTFYGSITVNDSGTSGSPITYGAYGSGGKPIITGFTTISGWTNEGNGIYSKAIASESSTNNIVTVDEVNTPMGRYPDTGYLSYESHSGNISITDNQLIGTPNWTGAELVLRRTDWTLNRNLITNHTNTIITYTPAAGTWDGPTDGFGYFIQNDIKTLDDVGDWYYDGATLHMYFGDNNPVNYIVKMSTLNELITTGIDYKTHSNYITLDNITFEGSKLATVYLGQYSSYWTIQNSSFNFNGMDGIYAVQSSFLTINNNTFNKINNNAIRTIWLGDHTVIRNNTITNIGILPGMGGIDDDSYDAIALQVRTSSNSSSIVEYNTLQHVGHIGMRMGGNGYIIQYNLITDYGLVKGDTGAIYTYHANMTIISNNIVLNSNDALEGIGSERSPGIHGIYLDNGNRDIIISGNTVYNITDLGIFVQGSQNIEVSNNTVYASGSSQLEVRSKDITAFISGINVHHNIFFAKTAGLTSYPYSPLSALFSTSLGDINTWGVFDNNYYIRPIDDDDVFRRYDYALPDPWNGTGLTLSQWQTYSGQDLNSHKSPKVITDVNDILFDYNATTGNKTVSLGSSSYMDVTGATYTGNVTLLPYTSIVLIK